MPPNKIQYPRPGELARKSDPKRRIKKNEKKLTKLARQIDELRTELTQLVDQMKALEDSKMSSPYLDDPAIPGLVNKLNKFAEQAEPHLFKIFEVDQERMREALRHSYNPCDQFESDYEPEGTGELRVIPYPIIVSHELGGMCYAEQMYNGDTDKWDLVIPPYLSDV